MSFVTSIATGIVTVSLLSQAPPAITQTVNRVVERTVETIVPKDSGSQVITNKETTVVVKEDDLITDSISGSLLKTGRVFADISTSSPVVALAAVIGSRTLLTDKSVLDGEHLVSIGNSTAIFKVTDRFPEAGIALLEPVGTTTALTNAFKVGDTGALKLGQTAIALVSVTQERVALGAVTAKSILAEILGKSGSKVSVRVIDTNVEANPVPGMPLINVFGDLVGISTSVVPLGSSFVSASDIVALLAGPKATSTPQQ